MRALYTAECRSGSGSGSGSVKQWYRTPACALPTCHVHLPFPSPFLVVKLVACHHAPFDLYETPIKLRLSPANSRLSIRPMRQ